MPHGTEPPERINRTNQRRTEAIGILASPTMVARIEDLWACSLRRAANA